MRAGGSLGFRLVRQRPRSHGTAVSGLHDSGRIVLWALEIGNSTKFFL